MNSEGDSARSPVAGAGGGPANLLDALKGMWPIARRANSGTLSQPSAASGRPVPAEARAPEPAPEPPEQLRPRAHSQPQQWNGNSAIALAGAADVLSQRRPSEPSNQPPFTGFTIQPLPVFPALSMPVAVVPPTHGTGGGIVQRYIPTQTMLGHGAWGSARLILRGADHRPFALKEFKKKPGDDEVPGRYERRCAHEFHSLSLLRHPNIVGVIEFEYDPRTQAAGLVLELVTGGDLYTAISSNTLTNQREIDCLFGQIVRAVAYMHSRGVAHRDLKPENMLWEPMTGCLKIIDFGSAEVFGPPLPTSGPADPEDVAFFAENQVAPEDIAVVNGRRIKLSRNVVGSAPYIAPEEFLGAGYDARGADVWACAIIYLAMCTRKFPWQTAMKSDARYLRYLTLAYLPVLGRLPQASRKIISRMLQPDPTKRATIEEVMADWWFRHLDVCQTTNRSKKHDHPAFAAALEIKRAAAAASALQQQVAVIPQQDPRNSVSNRSDDETTLNHGPMAPPQLPKQWSGESDETNDTSME